ncbi:hypothetical protein M409DRAFT_23418 [Zasmidium cellare ATCC 36951]|uniref:CENP-V/GFA domain-containing protein n=1 Tax=Zasmidium cellare ATCC 36951 TaxID=1080233 RepID=A0A6A6CLC4_ZASCE|nr:uncharacterized protein M409DRAFT_23418 [Zasmidium cellare ATCC 36951]KAF2166226.1 hypothetical protein M409DRAFT_23418 [Zasmidium cellare ATCC 36951]
MSTSSGKTGRCLCGKIEYELKGPSATPLYNTESAAQHSTLRRFAPEKYASPQFVLEAPSQPSTCRNMMHGFSVTKGAEYQKDYWDTNTDSGTNLKRVFCTECGTKLFAFTPLWDEIVSVAAGTLDDFDSWCPDTEQYCIHRAAFVEKAKGVERERSFKLAVKGGEIE